jgi:Fe-S cluster biogenesis protein NfuA
MPGRLRATVNIGNVPDRPSLNQTRMTEETSTIESAESAPSAEVDLDALNDTLEYIRPALQADGGDLILLGVEEGTVNLQLVGACGGCPMSTMTLTAGIERILRDRVPGVTAINAV